MRFDRFKRSSHNAVLRFVHLIRESGTIIVNEKPSRRPFVIVPKDITMTDVTVKDAF